MLFSNLQALCGSAELNASCRDVSTTGRVHFALVMIWKCTDQKERYLFVFIVHAIIDNNILLLNIIRRIFQVSIFFRFVWQKLSCFPHYTRNILDWNRSFETSISECTEWIRWLSLLIVHMFHSHWFAQNVDKRRLGLRNTFQPSSTAERDRAIWWMKKSRLIS